MIYEAFLDHQARQLSKEIEIGKTNLYRLVAKQEDFLKICDQNFDSDAEFFKALSNKEMSRDFCLFILGVKD